MKSIITSILILISGMISAQSYEKQDINIFPKPEKGFQQIVIDLPHSNNDQNKKVELYVGKTIEVDECNRHFLAGELILENLKGWGYNYYTFKTEGHIASTLMACSDNKKTRKFVSSEPVITRYNGLLPIVIYIPDGYEVKYKIYTTTNEEYFGAIHRSK